MIFAVVIIFLVAFGGLMLTYLFAEEETFLWRLAAGNIAGSTIFGIVGFLVACFSGLSLATSVISLLISLIPLALLSNSVIRTKLSADWEKAKGNLQGTNLEKFLSFGFYLFFFVLFIYFFDRAMFQNDKGIFTGGSQNLGDLPSHLGAIFSFTDGNNFPPQNPSFAGAKFSYPFIADFLTAVIIKFGAGVESAMLVQNVSWAFSLLVIVERFTSKLTGNKLAGKIAPILLFFSGGLGFLWFYKDFVAQSKGFFNVLLNLPLNYTIRDDVFSWGNSLVVLFMTQRSLLLGMPLTIIVLSGLWEVFSAETVLQGDRETRRQGEENTNGRSEIPESSTIKSTEKSSNSKISTTPLLLQSSSPCLLVSLSPLLLLGLLAGTLPLVHLHSLIVLFIVTAFLFVLRLEKWREWLIFGVGVCLIAVPEIAWTITGSASDTKEFFGWHFGWNKAADESFIWFWLKNTGAFLPLILAGIYFLLSPKNNSLKLESSSDPKTKDPRPKTQDHKPKIINLILFYLPFLFCFIIANIYKFAPWEWDNIKILIYWFIGSLPFVAYALARAWEENVLMKVIAAGLLIILTAAGALDVWRCLSKQINYNVFDADAVKIAEQIRQKTGPDALVLNAPTYNTPIVLTGRRSLMRYLGHLASYGIDYEARYEDVKRIYQGDAASGILLKKYNIEYVLISPKEQEDLMPNEDYFSKFPIVAQSGSYTLYQVK